MDSAIWALVGVVLAQAAAIWYKIGKCEQQIKDMSKDLNEHLRGRK